MNRILRDDPSKADMGIREALGWRRFWRSLCDYHLWPIYLLGLTWQLPSIPAERTLVPSIRAMKFDGWIVNLLTLPTATLWVINLLLFTQVSEWLNERLFLGVLSQIWVVPVLIEMEALPWFRSTSETYSMTFLLCAQPYIHAILLGLVSRNSGSVRTRTVSVALYTMGLNASNIIAVNVRCNLAYTCRRGFGRVCLKSDDGTTLPRHLTRGVNDWTLDLRIERFMSVRGCNIGIRTRAAAMQPS